MTTYSQEFLDKHRDINVDDSFWYEGVVDAFIEDMAEKGISVDDGKNSRPKVYFSGFWSQGVGACFEGKVSDFEKFVEVHDIQNPAIAALIQADAYLHFSCAQSGIYCHEHSVSFYFEYDADLYDADDLRQQVINALVTDEAMEQFEESAAEIFRDHMQDLYRKLEDEYDYLTSDEAIIETLESNEIEEEEEEEGTPLCSNY